MGMEISYLAALLPGRVSAKVEPLRMNPTLHVSRCACSVVMRMNHSLVHFRTLCFPVTAMENARSHQVEVHIDSWNKRKCFECFGAEWKRLSSMVDG
jgi:hypothetical protein